MVETSPLDLLLIEDNEDHAALVQRVLEAEGCLASLRVFENAESALSSLQRLDLRAPDLVLLDLNLPGMTGFEFLEQVKSDKSLRRVPVVILSTSDCEKDRAHAREHSANGYLTKPLEIEQFREVLKDAGLAAR